MFWLIDLIIVRPIINLLFVIYSVAGDFGLTIIIFTVIVKLAMWPLVKRQLQQTKLMRKIQPEVAQIKKNCKGNRQMESLQMMDLYKRYNVKPFRTMLTTLIQLPIFLALFMAISVMVNPRPSADTCGYTNVSNCVYSPLKSLNNVGDIITRQDAYFAAKDAGEDATYDFQPKLFGVIDLAVHPSDVLSGNINVSTVVVFLFAVGAAVLQFVATRQQSPSGKSKKSKTFRQLMKEAAAGNGSEPDQSEINELATRQMSLMMPIMMFFIMFYLPGALVFYYVLSSGVMVLQQRHALKQTEDEMEQSADKAVLKELRNVQEAKVVKNKKTGTKASAGKTKTNVTRISAVDNKKKRR